MPIKTEYSGAVSNPIGIKRSGGQRIKMLAFSEKVLYNLYINSNNYCLSNTKLPFLNKHKEFKRRSNKRVKEKGK